MLILTRKTGQGIYLGKNAEIKIKILSNDGKQIRMSVEAPKKIPIKRKELYEGIQNGFKESLDSYSTKKIYDEEINALAT